MFCLIISLKYVVRYYTRYRYESDLDMTCDNIHYDATYNLVSLS